MVVVHTLVYMMDLECHIVLATQDTPSHFLLACL